MTLRLVLFLNQIVPDHLCELHPITLDTDAMSWYVCVMPLGSLSQYGTIAVVSGYSTAGAHISTINTMCIRTLCICNA